jgi:hypothetical protein
LICQWTKKEFPAHGKSAKTNPPAHAGKKKPLKGGGEEGKRVEKEGEGYGSEPTRQLLELGIAAILAAALVFGLSLLLECSHDMPQGQSRNMRQESGQQQQSETNLRFAPPGVAPYPGWLHPVPEGFGTDAFSR